MTIPGAALAACAGALLLVGCAGPAHTTAGGAAPPGSAPPPAVPARDSATLVLELRMRRSAEMADDRGTLRVFDQDVSVEFRVAGKGPGLDAGEATLDDRAFRRVVNAKGGVTYRL